MKSIDAGQIESLEKLISRIGKVDAATLSEQAVAMSQDMTLHPSVRSLALDAMLVAQGDFNGEFESTAELLEAVKRLQEEEA